MNFAGDTYFGVKHVVLPEQAKHPKGWNTDISHQRKLKSYQVEINWYTDLAKRSGKQSRIPHLHYSHQLHSLFGYVSLWTLQYHSL